MNIKRKALLSPFIVIALIVLAGIGIAGASILLGGSGDSSSLGVNLQKGLVGWWKFDGDANDSTSNQNDGTLNGDAATTANDRKNEDNKALTLDGTGDYVQIADVSVLKPTTAITYGAWIRTSGGTNQFIIERQKNNYISYALRVNGSGAGAGANCLIGYIASPDTTTYSVTSNTKIGDSNWHHVVCTYDKANLRVYVDGVADNSTAGTNDIVYDGTTGVRIGFHVESDTYFNGRVDDVRIYNRAISAAEVTALYQEYNPGIQISNLQKGLVGWWKFDGNANDSTSNQNDGIITGAVLANDRKGEAQKAYGFNGVGDYISVNNSASLNPTSITVSFWMNETAFSTAEQDLITKWGSAGVGNWGIWKSSGAGTNLVMYMKSGGVSFGGLSSGSLNNNTWYHIVYTYDGVTERVYVNGVAGSTNTLNQAMDTNSGTLVIGNDSGHSFPFNGQMDDVRVYNRALSSAEITALYQEYNPGLQISNLQTGLVGQWKMDGNTNDSTSYGNDGTVTGAVLANDRKGEAQKAYGFNGTSTYISVANSPSFTFTSGDFSASMWIYWNTTNDVYPFIITGLFQASGWYMQNSGTTAFDFVTNQSGATTAQSSKTNVIGAGAWYHIVATKSGKTVKLYVNGVDQTAAHTDVTDPVSSPSTMYFGANFGGVNRWLDGRMDDIRIYNRALSQTEVTALYQSY